ncbi:MAG: MFS transporter, partial [Rubrivivax sp.]|nr:MFS transporter [Rubrivivax sp.]
LFALPLAFAALPLYVQWPAHAAATGGLPLAWLGALLLAVRVADAFVDPWIGARVDALFARSTRHAWAAAGAAAAAAAGGIAALMFAPAAVVQAPPWLLAWSAGALVVTSLGYSVAMVTHQAWAVRFGGGAAEQARWVGAREALALAGVIAASLLPALAGWPVTVGALAALLLVGWWRLGHAPPGRDAILPPRMPGGSHGQAGERWGTAAARGSQTSAAAPGAAASSPWQDAGFRRLVPVLLLSGFASAIPASLFVLFVRDRLQADAAAEGWLLGLYFAAAASAMPLWVRAVRRFGLLRAWFAGMWIAIVAFAGAVVLGPGDLPWFTVVCVASGLALGAELVVPPALLAGLIQRRNGSGESRGAAASSDASRSCADGGRGVEGLWFGWWNFATKLTLAAAAGLALPLVQWLGYSPGARDEHSLFALALCYALLPCAVKAVAAAALWAQRHHWAWALAPGSPARSEPKEEPDR